ncbi:MAG: parallel beta-helix domain-containing protein [Pseudomonadota bacterium]
MEAPEPPAPAANSYQETLQLQLLDAQPGDVITIPAGRHAFNRSLRLGADGVTIRGAGMDETVLSFADQRSGAEGLLVTGSDFTIEDLAIEDTTGDALKINEAQNVVIRRVRTEWTGGPKTENGAYGLYPVQTRNVLIEDCVAIGASDAGIYVGQSEQVVVRNNRAEYNVAGIEIENTRHADVYGNVATNNTGGILVFNMPNLPQTGTDVRVYDNDVFENNTTNFGIPGTAVASVPAGSGVVVNSHDRIEIFANRIRNNRTANIIISSMYSSGWAAAETVAGFDPYPDQISIRDNTFEGGGDSPDGLDLKALKTLMFGLTGAFPDVIWDGHVATDEAAARICVADPAVEVLNVDGPNGNKSPRVEREPHACALTTLAPVTLAAAP